MEWRVKADSSVFSLTILCGFVFFVFLRQELNSPDCPEFTETSLPLFLTAGIKDTHHQV